MSATVVRAMTSGDLPDVSSVTNAAFGARVLPAAGAGPGGPGIPVTVAVRFAADPGGCFVAVREQEPGQVAGALMSVARGTLGWLGPLAVYPHAQRSGAGGKLVAACLDSWRRRRGVRLMGLETYRDSRFHRRFYKERASGRHAPEIGFRAQLGGTGMPAGVRIGARCQTSASCTRASMCPARPQPPRGAAPVMCSPPVMASRSCTWKVPSGLPRQDSFPFLAAATRDSFERAPGRRRAPEP